MAKKINLHAGAAIIIAFTLDQLSKWWLLDIIKIGERPPIEIAPFFNLVMVWNRGISFGMFSSYNQQFMLIGLSLAIIAVLAYWLTGAHSRLVAIAIGLTVGGALGNIADRLRFGAVADFFDFHLGMYHWPAFNIADSAIFIGVVLLCWHSMFTERKQPDSEVSS